MGKPSGRGGPVPTYSDLAEELRDLREHAMVAAQNRVVQLLGQPAMLDRLRKAAAGGHSSIVLTQTDIDLPDSIDFRPFEHSGLKITRLRWSLVDRVRISWEDDYFDPVY